MTKNILLFSGIVSLIVILAFVFGSSTPDILPPDSSTNNNTNFIESFPLSTNGQPAVQIFEERVQGNYFPKVINAKAGVAMILRMKSTNAYGCERAFRIPKLGISQTLPINGSVDINIPSQVKNTLLTGTCAMGMYSFVINFN